MISIYEIAELFGIAYSSAFTPQNIINGFQSTGIWKLNRTVFEDGEFLCSSITDGHNSIEPHVKKRVSERVLRRAMHIIRSETLGRRLVSAKSLATSLAESLTKRLAETVGETFIETLSETFRARRASSQSLGLDYIHGSP